ncbi:unnamed protein product, partial [Ectocarpus sp. 4 AP-2014]
MGVANFREDERTHHRRLYHYVSRTDSPQYRHIFREMEEGGAWSLPVVRWSTTLHDGKLEGVLQCFIFLNEKQRRILGALFAQPSAWLSSSLIPTCEGRGYLPV